MLNVFQVTDGTEDFRISILFTTTVDNKYNAIIGVFPEALDEFVNDSLDGLFESIRIALISRRWEIKKMLTNPSEGFQDIDGVQERIEKLLKSHQIAE